MKLFLLLVLASVFYTVASVTRKIAAFNIQTYGPTKAGKPDVMDEICQVRNLEKLTPFYLLLLLLLFGGGGFLILELINFVLRTISWLRLQNMVNYNKSFDSIKYILNVLYILNIFSIYVFPYLSRS